MRNLKRLFLSAAVSAGLVILGDMMLGFVGYSAEMLPGTVWGVGRSHTVKWLESSYTMTTNDQGIRYKSIPLTKQTEDEERVAVLGDSFTEGQGVEAEQSWPSLLEAEFSSPRKPVHFINGGAAGAGPSNYAAVFYNVSMRYHPNRLLILFYANDVDDTRINERTGIKYALHAVLPRTYVLLSKSVFVFRERVESPTAFLDEALKEAAARGISPERVRSWRSRVPPRTIELIAQDRLWSAWITNPLLDPTYMARSLDLDEPGFDGKWQAVDNRMSRLVAYSRARGINVAASYAPHPYQYDPLFDDLPERLGLVVRHQWLTTDAPIQQRLAGWAAREEVPFLDLTEPFRAAAKASSEPLNFRVDAHWNPKGHQLAARLIRDWLNRIWPNLSS